MTTYAIHLPDGGTSEFTNFSFNSVAELGGKRYALRSDGLYELGGDSDAGVAIDAKIGLGFSEPGSLNTYPAVYLEANAGDKLEVIVPVGDTSYSYPTRTYSDDQRLLRAELGRGIRENRLYLVIKNMAGAAFTLFNTSLDHVKSRRI